MTPGEKIRAVLRDSGVQHYDLLWQTGYDGKPHSFRVSVRDVTLNGCTTRAIIRAIRRRFSKDAP